MLYVEYIHMNNQSRHLCHHFNATSRNNRSYVFITYENMTCKLVRLSNFRKRKLLLTRFMHVASSACVLLRLIMTATTLYVSCCCSQSVVMHCVHLIARSFNWLHQPCTTGYVLAFREVFLDVPHRVPHSMNYVSTVDGRCRHSQ
jgi:hypothetical protein